MTDMKRTLLKFGSSLPLADSNSPILPPDIRRSPLFRSSLSVLGSTMELRHDDPRTTPDTGAFLYKDTIKDIGEDEVPTASFERTILVVMGIMKPDSISNEVQVSFAGGRPEGRIHVILAHGTVTESPPAAGESEPSEFVEIGMGLPTTSVFHEGMKFKPGIDSPSVLSGEEGAIIRIVQLSNYNLLFKCPDESLEGIMISIGTRIFREAMRELRYARDGPGRSNVIQLGRKAGGIRTSALPGEGKKAEVLKFPIRTE